MQNSAAEASCSCKARYKVGPIQAIMGYKILCFCEIPREIHFTPITKVVHVPGTKCVSKESPLNYTRTKDLMSESTKDIHVYKTQVFLTMISFSYSLQNSDSLP